MSELHPNMRRVVTNSWSFGQATDDAPGCTMAETVDEMQNLALEAQRAIEADAWELAANEQADLSNASAFADERRWRGIFSAELAARAARIRKGEG